MKKLLFKEEQKFNQWWLWVILVGAFAVSVVPLWYGLLSQLTTGEPWGDNPASDVILAVTTGAITLLMGGVVILFFIRRGIQQKKEKASLDDIEAGTAFWHMCDLIWLLLFPILYLLF